MLGLGGPSGSSGGSATRSGEPVQLPQDTVFQAGQAPAGGPTPDYPVGSPSRPPLGELPSAPDYSPGPKIGTTPTSGTCLYRYRQGVRNGLSVTAGAASATVKWWNLLDPALQEFQLAAVEQPFELGDQKPWVWKKVTVPTGCVQLSTPFSGLVSGHKYVFVLHAVLRNYASVPPIVPEVGRSETVEIT